MATDDDLSIPDFLDRTKAEPKGWRDVLPIHSACDLFPPISADERKVLGEDIKSQGMVAPVSIWTKTGELLDGRNRLDAMECVGLPVIGDDGKLQGVFLNEYDGDDPWGFVIAANIRRRHLSAKQRRDLIAKVIAARPEKSDRAIAADVGVSHQTVARARKATGPSGPVETPRTGLDGKARKQPRKKPRTAADDRDDKTAKTEPVAANSSPDSDADLVEQALELVDKMTTKQRQRFFAALRSEYDRAGLSKSAQEKLDAAIRQQTKKLAHEFERCVQAEVTRRINEIVLPSFKASIAIADSIVKARKGFMSKETFNTIRRALHPDSRQSISDHKLGAAFDTFMGLEKYLLNEKDSPTTVPRLPSSLAEWDKMRAKATAERKAKRAANSVRPRQ